jgi:ubiquinone/menaquinone biosynthesis C-methylase UbiE
MRVDAGELATTREAYDAVARDYARLVPDMSLETPLDRAVLAAFAEMLNEHADALIADIGCGSGRVTEHLSGAGLRVVGLDLSPAMVTIARGSHEELPFVAAHAAALPFRSGAVGGLISWYSLINLPTSALPEVFTEFARVMRPRAPVVVAFQCGDGERVDRTTSYEQPVSLTYYRHRIDDVSEALDAAGFASYASVNRAPVLAFESTPQAILLAHR